MPTYDAAIDYDDPGVLYDGVELGAGLALILDGAEVIDYLADRSLGVHVATHGNSLGTLDALLNDPPFLPTVEQGVSLYLGTERLYRGTVRSTGIDEFRGGHLFAGFSAQDAGPDESGIPTAAPFGVSDTPNGTTTRGYEKLSEATRTTEGGSPKTTYRLTFREHGLFAGMNVEVTSAAHGLSAEEFTIVEADVTWPTPDAPKYVLTLGEPLVKLAQVMLDLEATVPDGSITETKIAEGAITTPKLAANAVIAQVANVGGSVIIDADGIAITGGRLTVVNDGGTTIIDGQSNMFKIVATGTLTFLDGAINSVDLATGLDYRPAFLSYFETGGGAKGTPWSVGSDVLWADVAVVNGNETRLRHVHTTSSGEFPGRFFIMKEASI